MDYNLKFNIHINHKCKKLDMSLGFCMTFLVGLVELTDAHVRQYTKTYYYIS